MAVPGGLAGLAGFAVPVGFPGVAGGLAVLGIGTFPALGRGGLGVLAPGGLAVLEPGTFELELGSGAAPCEDWAP